MQKKRNADSGKISVQEVHTKKLY